MWATARQSKVVGGESRATWDDHPSKGSRMIWRLCHQVGNHNCFSFPASWGIAIFICLPKSVHASSIVPLQHMPLWKDNCINIGEHGELPILYTFPGNCVLNGTWKLLFTDAADATFRRGKRTEPWSFTCSVIYMYTHGWLKDHWIPTSSRHMVG